MVLGLAENDVCKQVKVTNNTEVYDVCKQVKGTENTKMYDVCKEVKVTENTEVYVLQIVNEVSCTSNGNNNSNM